MSHSFVRLGSTLLGSICLLQAPTLLAQEPTCEATCPRGYSCAVVELCSSGPEFRNVQESCEKLAVCSAAACSSDADCDPHMRCNQDASAAEPATCLPRWYTHCAADADCGAGFTCAQELPCLDPTAADAASCVPEGELVCYIHTRACQSDADCIEGWSCDNNPINAYWAGTDGAMGCNIVDPALICKPPFARQFGLGPGYLDWQTGVEWTHRAVPVDECPAPITREDDFQLAGSVGGVVEGSATINPQGVANENDSTSPTASSDNSETETEMPSSASVPEASAPVASVANGGGCALDGVSGRRSSTSLFGVAIGLSLVAARLRRRR